RQLRFSKLRAVSESPSARPAAPPVKSSPRAAALAPAGATRRSWSSTPPRKASRLPRDTNFGFGKNLLHRHSRSADKIVPSPKDETVARRAGRKRLFVHRFRPPRDRAPARARRKSLRLSCDKSRSISGWVAG